MRLAATTAFLLAALAAGPARADCLEDIRTILASSLTSGPYVVEMTSKAGDLAITAEVVPPDAMHSRTVIAGKTSEVTVLDGKAWIDMGDGWASLPDTMADTMLAGFRGTEAMLDSIAGEECLGPQNVDGRDLLAFRYDITMASVPTKSTMYVDPSTRLPVILENLSGAAGSGTDTRAVYRYDAAIEVVAPAR